MRRKCFGSWDRRQHKCGGLCERTRLRPLTLRVCARSSAAPTTDVLTSLSCRQRCKVPPRAPHSSEGRARSRAPIFTVALPYTIAQLSSCSFLKVTLYNRPQAFAAPIACTLGSSVLTPCHIALRLKMSRVCTLCARSRRPCFKLENETLGRTSGDESEFPLDCATTRLAHACGLKDGA